MSTRKGAVDTSPGSKSHNYVSLRVGLKEKWQFDPSAMYTAAVRQFIENFGYLDPDAVPVPGQGYMPKPLEDYTDPTERAVEEQKCDKYQKALRTRIANWARHTWQRKKSDAVTVATTIAAVMSVSAAPPRKPTELQYYQGKVWEEHLKAKFNTHWDKMKDQASGNQIPTQPSLRPENRMLCYFQGILNARS
ncbi:hypothetical protein PQX77_020217 [Marasmius sp. AFHP31]|nr:hypothetical protein PQX77_020217 [Marasmius sp. AFHP31]